MKPTSDSFKVDNDVKIAALLVATIASFFTPFMGTSINIALPTIGLDFGADAILLNWITNGFLLAAAIFAVPLGRVADIHGMKKIFTYGIIIFTVASLFCALSPSSLCTHSFQDTAGNWFGHDLRHWPGHYNISFPTTKKGESHRNKYSSSLRWTFPWPCNWGFDDPVCWLEEHIPINDTIRASGNRYSVLEAPW